MKKIIIVIGILLVLILGYWLVSPFFITKKVSEDLPIVQTQDATNQVKEVKKGIFTGFDKVHTGSGTARVVTIGTKNYIRFDEDFNVNNGPDLYVGLGENGSYIKGSELSKLKGTIGSQNYELPQNIDPTQVKEVWVWCKAFSVPFTKAVLENI